jgi:antibiotic biosynthesis monooxygenase (ABM) superfamily enzyme
MLWIIIDFFVLPALILLPFLWVKKLVPELQATQVGCWLLFITFVFVPKLTFVFIPGVGGMFMGVGTKHKILPLQILGMALIAFCIICFV